MFLSQPSDARQYCGDAREGDDGEYHPHVSHPFRVVYLVGQVRNGPGNVAD